VKCITWQVLNFYENQGVTQGEAIELLLEAGAPSEAVLTVTMHRPNRAAIARSPSTVSIIVSLQNRFSVSSRSRGVKPHHVSCTVAGASDENINQYFGYNHSFR
jgi:hypothetical protein